MASATKELVIKLYSILTLSSYMWLVAMVLDSTVLTHSRCSLSIFGMVVFFSSLPFFFLFKQPLLVITFTSHSPNTDAYKDGGDPL